MLHVNGPWPPPCSDVADELVEVSFDDEQGRARRVRVRHQTLGDGRTP